MSTHVKGWKQEVTLICWLTFDLQGVVIVYLRWKGALPKQSHERDVRGGGERESREGEREGGRERSSPER